MKSVLIVDDEIDICFLLSSLLKKKSFDITVVNTLADGLNVLDTQQPTIIFLDNHLPDGKGVNSIDKFKEKSPDSKIIMITANDTPIDRTVAFKNGVDYFMGKPFNGKKVFSAMEEIDVNVE